MPGLSRRINSSLHQGLECSKPKQEVEEDIHADPISDSDEYGEDVFVHEVVPQVVVIDGEDKENESLVAGKVDKAPTRASRRRGKSDGPLNEVQAGTTVTVDGGNGESPQSLKRKRDEPADISPSEKARRIAIEDKKEENLIRDWKMSERSQTTFGSQKLGSNFHSTYGSSQRARILGSQASSHNAGKKGAPNAFQAKEKSPVGTKFDFLPALPSGSATKSSAVIKHLTPASSIDSAKARTKAFQHLEGAPQSSSSSSPLSSVPASSGAEEVEEEDDDSMSVPDDPEDLAFLSGARCPSCRNPVDANDLAVFKFKWRNGIYTRNQAQRFCDDHKAKDAQKQWEVSQYPTIDWSTFMTRLERFDDTMAGILHQRIPSSYRQELEEKAKEGHLSKRLRDADASAVARNAGYFGERGADLMSEHILSRFMADLRQISTTDHLFMDLQAAGFVQSILIPELALLLIRDDYYCDEERAKEIMKESAEVGEALNREEVGAVDDLRADLKIKNEDIFEDIDSIEELVDVEEMEEKPQSPPKTRQKKAEVNSPARKLDRVQKTQKTRKSNRQSGKECEIIAIS